MRGSDTHPFLLRSPHEEDKLWTDDAHNVIRKGHLILKHLLLVNLKNKKIHLLLYNKLNIILVKIWCLSSALVNISYN